MASVEERMEQLSLELTSLKTEVKSFAGALANEKAQFTDEVNKEFAMHKLAIQEVVTAARAEFDRQRVDHERLYQETSQAVQGLIERMEKVEMTTGNGGTAKEREKERDKKRVFAYTREGRITHKISRVARARRETRTRHNENGRKEERERAWDARRAAAQTRVRRQNSSPGQLQMLSET